jgi:hypothetical protein
MVYYHDDLGKRHDKSFGRGELGKAKAEAFEKAVQEANEKLLPIPDPETVTAGIRVAAKAAGAKTETTVPPANQVIEKEPSGITLSELGKKYLDHMRASGRTEKHIRNVERLLDNQFVPVIGDKPVDALTYQGDMVPFILHFKGVSGSTGKERSQHGQQVLRLPEFHLQLRDRACSFIDGFTELEPLLEKADAVVFCSPLYWFSFTAQIKAAIDKMNAYDSENALRHLNIKESALLVCGACDGSTIFDGIITSFKLISNYLNWQVVGILAIPGVKEKGDILKSNALDSAEKLGIKF